MKVSVKKNFYGASYSQTFKRMISRDSAGLWNEDAVDLWFNNDMHEPSATDDMLPNV